MAAKLQTSSFLVCLVHVAFCCTAFGEVQFAYSGFRGADDLAVDGAAAVRPDGLLQLTNSSDVKGHAFHPAPLRFRDNSPGGGAVRSFAVSLVFVIQPDDFTGVSVDGMAFLVAPGKNFSGAFADHYLGLFNDQTDGSAGNRVFAVELDTFQNGELRDIDGNHVGVDINSVVSVRARTAGFYNDTTGIFTNLTLSSGEPMQLWIEYDAETARIESTLAPIGVPKPRRPLLSATANLSDVLQDPSYVGFSGATGPINTLFYVLGWSFAMNSTSAPDIHMSNLPKLPHGHKKKKTPRSTVLEIILPVSTAMLIAIVGTAVVLLARRRLRYAEVWEDWEVEFGPHRFSYKELYVATEGFKAEHILGVGGFGMVYKGVLPTSQLEVAVKKVSHDSRQGTREFIAEVVSIGRLRHRNLVQLLGYCRRKDELLLVYEYMPNGSLDKFLHCNKEGEPTLGWTQRHAIMRDVACALLYLHEKWDKIVVHRDIKAGNVLLDGEMNGRLGDFGLARLYDHGTDLHTTRLVGTMGYLAPELVRTGKSSPLTDVFAFGMFLLEVTCGQRPLMKQDGHQEDRPPIRLVDWVLEHWHNGSLTQAVDARLVQAAAGTSYNDEEASMVLKLGLMCLLPSPSARPSMRQIVQYLDGDMPLPADHQLPPLTSLLSSSTPSSAPDYLTVTGVGTFSDLSGGR